MYVLAALDANARVLKFGPTSESHALLMQFDWARAPSAAVAIVVLRVLPGPGLRVGMREAREALADVTRALEVSP